MKFRPCIDLHNGKVKQIVGSTLTDETEPQTNFISPHPPEWFARRYREDGLQGGHIIKLGSGNDEAARQALAAWPGGLQIGGGITPENAAEWLDAGASHIIVTSYLFQDGAFSSERLQELVKAVGKDRIVLDLSCRRRGSTYFIVTDRWQTFTQTPVHPETLQTLARSCAEFLIHGVDVEGKQQGIDIDLLQLLADHTPLPTTYAGGIRSLEDLELIRTVGRDRIDATVGSALDLFGGSLSYQTVLRYAISTQK